MIRLDFLASKLNEILGTDKYAVYLNSNAFPDDLGDRNVVTMNVLRIPFGFGQDELDAESLTITLTFDLPCDAYGEELYIRDGALAHIQSRLLGHKSFDVECPNDEWYTVNTYFEQQAPANPYVDSGRITQQIVLSGAALVQNMECQAVVGNNVKVSIDGQDLLKIERTSAVQIGGDNNIPLSEGTNIPELQAISKVGTKAISFLYTGKDIEKEFIKIAEGFPFDINKIYKYKVSYGSFIIEVPCKLTSVSSQDSTGVFLQYTLNMQIVGDATEV
jgi:hypothetical protein